MKRIVTVVFILFVAVTSFAQSGRYGRDGGWSGRNDNSYRNERNNSYNNAERERDRLIFDINREFDAKIRSVRNQWFTRPSEKARRIRSLEIERDYRISQVNERYYRTANRNDRGRW